MVVTGKHGPNARLHTEHLGLDVDAVVGGLWGDLKGGALVEHGASVYVGDHVLDVAAYDRWLEDYRARLVQESSDGAERAARMNRVNPKYVLRNHLAQAAIEKAQAGDFAEIETLRALLARPFDEQPAMERYAAPAPPGTQRVEVSCSS